MPDRSTGREVLDAPEHHTGPLAIPLPSTLAFSEFVREPSLDLVAELAAVTCHAPLAAIRIDVDGVASTVTRGFDDPLEAQAATALCAHVQAVGTVEIADLRQDPRLAALVPGGRESRLRFCGGVAIETADGGRIGALVVLAHDLRLLDVSERASLRRLIGVAVRLVEAGRAEQRAAWLGQILDASMSEIYVADVGSSSPEYASPGALLNLGYSLDELRARRLDEILPSDEAAKLADRLKPIVDGTRAYVDFETSVVRKDGSVFPIEARVQLWRGSDRPLLLAVAKDITDRRRAEDVLRRHRAAMDAATDGMVIVDRDVRILYANRAQAALSGYDSPEDLKGLSWKALHTDAEVERLVRDILPELRRERQWTGDVLSCHRDGTPFPTWVTLTLFEDGGGVCVCRDDTERKAAEEALFRQKELAEITLRSIGDAVLTTDRAGRVSYLNPMAEAMTGWSLPEATRRPVAEVFRLQAVDGVPAVNPVHIALEENRTIGLTGDATLTARDGRTVAVQESAAPIHDRQGHVVGAVLVFRDVTESHAMARRMAHLAQHDALTDLPNRLLLRDRLQQAFGGALRRGTKVAVLFVDLDHFKHVNDSLGHETGDKLLQQVAKRLSACVRESDTVSRQGGDEFVVLLNNLPDATGAARVADKMLAACAQPYIVDGHELHVGVSIGASIFPDDGRDLDVVMRNADAAMYHAKELGRNSSQFYAPGMNERAQERFEQENGLRRALKNQEFELRYQPVLSLETGGIEGCEALLRWRNPSAGVILPDAFLTVAEQNGLIVPIGLWVLREACAQGKRWVDAGLRLPVSVNVSAVQFRRDDFVACVTDVLRETGLPPSVLTLELTESTIMRDADASARMLHQLRELGVRVSIDDFGTGYSSLGQLRRFPIDTLKIDQTFIRDLSVDADDAAITSAILSMAKSLRLRVVAEGVETAEQVEFLRARGCDAVQGFLFHEPLDAAALTALFA